MSGPKVITVAPIASPFVAPAIVVIAAAAGMTAGALVVQRYLDQKRQLSRLAMEGTNLQEYVAELKLLGIPTRALEKRISQWIESATDLNEQGLLEEAGELIQDGLKELEVLKEQVRAQAHEDALRAQRSSRQARRLRARILSRVQFLRPRVEAVLEGPTPGDLPGAWKSLLELADLPPAPEHGQRSDQEAWKSHQEALEIRWAQIQDLATICENHPALNNVDEIREKAGIRDFQATRIEDHLEQARKESDAEKEHLEKLDRLMASLAALKDSAAWSHLMKLMEATAEETDLERRRLAYESLVLQASDLLSRRETLERFRQTIDQLLEEAAPAAGTAVDPIVQELKNLRRAGVIQDLKEITGRLRSTMQEEEARLEKERRRLAILESLEAMGYETREDMQSALVKAGRLEFRKPGQGPYAVEVITNAELNTFQTALVRHSEDEEDSEMDRLRDLEAEEKWCTDHAALRETLKERGLEAKMVLQLQPGEHPVKIIRSEGAGQTASTARSPGKQAGNS